MFVPVTTVGSNPIGCVKYFDVRTFSSWLENGKICGTTRVSVREYNTAQMGTLVLPQPITAGETLYDLRCKCDFEFDNGLLNCIFEVMRCRVGIEIEGLMFDTWPWHVCTVVWLSNNIPHSVVISVCLLVAQLDQDSMEKLKISKQKIGQLLLRYTNYQSSLAITMFVSYYRLTLSFCVSIHNYHTT